MGIEQDNIKKAIKETLYNCELESVAADMLDITADALIGVAENIPIFKAIVSIKNAANNIRDYFFLDKLMNFLYEIRDISPEKRAKELDKIDGSLEYKTKVGEKLLFIIDHCEDAEKSQMIGHLFRCFILGEIDYREFLKAASTLNRIDINDFKDFLSDNDCCQYESELVGLGLIYFDVGEITHQYTDLKIDEDDEGNYTAIPALKAVGGQLKTHLTPLGEFLKKIFIPYFQG